MEENVQLQFSEFFETHGPGLLSEQLQTVSNMLVLYVNF